MKRRQAILGILGIGAATTVGVGGYKWFDWHKQPDINYLDTHKQTIGALADTIIPPTPDAPGAKEAKATDYIIVMVKDGLGRVEQNRFIDGLKDIHHSSIAEFDKPYYQITPAQQISLLQQFEKSGKPIKGVVGKVQNKFLGKSFFNILKELTVVGYCSSEIGAKKGLSYSHIPTQYIGCVSLQKGQKSWATI